MDERAWGPDTVLMPVPLPFAPQVAEYLAALRAGRTAAHADATSTASVEVVQVAGQEWTTAMVVELADRTPYHGVVALLDRCAESPGTWVLKADVEEAQGISPVQLRNELSAFSKLTKRLFGTATWPMQYKKEQGSYYYRMDNQIARWWLETRSA
jgi:hypothetical protein